MADADLTEVEVVTEEGAFLLGIDEVRAPLTARNFLAYVDGQHLDGATVYRIVTSDHSQSGSEARIEVIQWGWRASSDDCSPPLPPVPHEPTSMTGLRHVNGTLSLARRAPGTGGHGFFITVGDQPELDEGGNRNPDKAGFAAFGRVLAGSETIRRIYDRAESGEYLQTPILILSVTRRDMGR